jgi:hypothetical protein
VIKIENMCKNYSDGTFYPTQPSSGEMGEFCGIVKSDKELRDSLFSLEKGSAYSEPIALSGGSWAVVKFDSEQTDEQKKAIS